MNSENQTNPYNPPTPEIKPDEKRMYQLWVANFDGNHLKAKFFMNGQLKVYINEDLVYNETKWLSFREAVEVEYNEYHVVIKVKSNLFSLKNKLFVNGVEEVIEKKLNYEPGDGNKKTNEDGLTEDKNELPWTNGTTLVAIGGIIALIYYYVIKYIG